MDAHRTALTLRRFGRAGAVATAVVGLVAAGTVVARAADPGQPGYISINGSMEGNLQIQPGDWVGGGYQFDYAGNHPASTVQFTGATVTLNVSCSSSGTSPSPYVIDLAAGPYNVAAGSSAKYPYSPSDSNGSMQGDPAKWEGTAQIPALCGAGNAMWVNAQSGAATFAANVQSDDTTDAIQVQFHYTDSGTVDCSNTTQNPPPGGVSVCGRSWSSTPTVTPGPVPNAGVPEGSPGLLLGAGGVVLLASVSSLRRPRPAGARRLGGAA